MCLASSRRSGSPTSNDLLLLPPAEMDRSTAAAATLLIRFATLWFAVLLGLAALALLSLHGWSFRAGNLAVPGH